MKVIKYLLILLSSSLSILSSSNLYAKAETHFRITADGVLSASQYEKELKLSDKDYRNIFDSNTEANQSNTPQQDVQHVGAQKISTNAQRGKAYVVRGKRYTPFTKVSYYSEKGTASWYGPGFHGRLTANGERFNQEALTAAHKELPINSMVKVTNQNTGKSIVVRINDRGPFHGNRIIDLSFGAAKKLGIAQQGHANVKLELLPKDGRPAGKPIL